MRSSKILAAPDRLYDTKPTILACDDASGPVLSLAKAFKLVSKFRSKSSQLRNLGLNDFQLSKTGHQPLGAMPLKFNLQARMFTTTFKINDGSCAKFRMLDLHANS